MLTYQYKFYNSKRLRKLDELISSAAFVWNHCLALQKRYYTLYGQYVKCARMQSHFAKKVKPRFPFLANLNSQTVQEIIERLDTAYQRFFKKLAKRPPKFRKRQDFTSILFKQCGWRIDGNVFTINSLKQGFKFSLSRTYDFGKIKNVRVKRTSTGYYLYLAIDGRPVQTYGKTHDGASVGMDFGLKTYLTLSDGDKVENPLFFKTGLSEVRKANKVLSKKVKGSNHRRAARRRLARVHEKIANRRGDWQWKLAHELCRRFDYILVEDLQLTGMQRRWGRKVGDLAFSEFLLKLRHIASKYGCVVHEVDRFYASSKTCSDCGEKLEKLPLDIRSWVCPHCGAVHDRDVNAAVNILRRGVSELESGRKTAQAADRAIIQESHGL